MQFKPWFEIYEKNKDSIKDKEQFFLEWRKQHKEFLERAGHSPLPSTSFLNELNYCKTVFYPGCGYDFTSLLLFANWGCISTFYFCDYSNREITEETVYSKLVEELTPFGYTVQHIARLNPEYFNKQSWKRYWHPGARASNFGDVENSFISLYRLKNYHRTYDLFYFGTDAINTYEVLLKNQIQLDVVVTQDHGFGGLWTTFCKGSLLEELSRKSKRMPRLLFTGEGQEPWDNYIQISDPFGEFGMHGNKRVFYRHDQLPPAEDFYICI